jgi:hypothetical protein
VSIRSTTAIQPQLGAVALVFHPAKADLQLHQMPLTRSEAGSSRAADALAELRQGPTGDPGGAIILLPAVIGLATAGGWIRGAFSGMDADVVNQTVATLARAAVDLKLVDRLSGAIVAHAHEFADRGVTIPTTMVAVAPPSQRPRYRAGPDGTVQRAPPPLPPHPLADQGIDTIAVIDCRTHALVGDGSKNPNLSLQIEIHVRLFRTADWSEAGAFTADYVGQPRPFAEWARDNATPFRHEWNQTVQDLEQRIIAALQRQPATTARR